MLFHAVAFRCPYCLLLFCSFILLCVFIWLFYDVAQYACDCHIVFFWCHMVCVVAYACCCDVSYSCVGGLI